MMLSERIKFMRESIGKTQKEMASLLGLAMRTWQNYEEGIHEPSWKALSGLVRFGVNANWLLTGEGRPFIDNSSVKQREDFQEGQNVEVIASIDTSTLKDILKTIKDVQVELLSEGLIEESSFLNIEDYADLIAFMYEDSLAHEEVGSHINTKKAKVKRLFKIARELKGK